MQQGEDSSHRHLSPTHCQVLRSLGHSVDPLALSLLVLPSVVTQLAIAMTFPLIFKTLKTLLKKHTTRIYYSFKWSITYKKLIIMLYIWN